MSEIASREEWMRRTGPLYPGIVALRRQTAAPVLTATEPSEEDLTRAAGWSSLVGALLGGLLAAIAMTFIALDVSAIVAAAVVLLIGMLATAAQYERGLAATVERLAGATSYTQDSRGALGAPGVIALLAALGLRGACLVGTSTDAWIGALVSSQAVIPAAAVLLLKIADRTDSPLSTRRGLMFGSVGWVALAVSSAIACVACVVFGGAVGILAVVVAALLAFGLGLALQRRDGGVGADSLAAVAVSCELIVLLTFSIAYPS